MEHNEMMANPIRHIRFIGYGLTNAWSFMLLFVPLFGAHDSTIVVSGSMLSGALCGLILLLVSPKLQTIAGRKVLSFLFALGASIGTLLYAYPMFPSSPVALLGLLLSGFCFIGIVASWFENYACLSTRDVVLLAGCSFLFAAILCLVIAAVPIDISALLLAALPIASFALMPHSLVEKPHATTGEQETAAQTAHSLIDNIKASVKWRTLAGLFVTFFALGSIGALMPASEPPFDFGIKFLIIPVIIFVFFAVSALTLRSKVDMTILYKVMLASFAALVFLFSNSENVPLSMVFSGFITADVLMWIMLLLIAKKSPAKPMVVFIIGWFAECAGNVSGHIVAPLCAGESTIFVAAVLMFIVLTVGLMFSDGQFVLDFDIEADESSVHVEETPVEDSRDAIREFCEHYGLSPRESEVCEMWLTGHGLKYIQENLFISEATVKTHVRNIYRKCDTHNRAEILALYEAGLEK